MAEQFSLACIQQAYDTLDNYKVLRIRTQGRAYILFSSHAIYYPNTEESAKDTIFNKDRYEWAKGYPKDAALIVFVRDIWKQWYLKGINKNTSDYSQLISKLNGICEGHPIVCAGVSGGGFAAIRCGVALEAVAIFAFAAQADLRLEINKADGHIKNEIVAKHAITNPNEISLIEDLAHANTDIYYFYGRQCNEDFSNAAIFRNARNVIVYDYPSELHGAPLGGQLLGALISSPPPLLRLIKWGARYGVTPLFLLKAVAALSLLKVNMKAATLKR
jgi:hypothetical protein